MKKTNNPLPAIFSALNAIIWVDERNRRNYNYNEEVWKRAIEEMNSDFKADEDYKDYKDISEVMYSVY